MSISASLVKALRERTGAGMMECKKALVETDGDIELAIENLRKSGQAKADKKAGRVTAEGAVVIASSDDARRAAMVEVNCETDFVAKEQDFKDFCQAVAERALALEPLDVRALLSSPLRDDAEQTIEERRRELVAKIGENIEVRRMQLVNAIGGRLGTYLHGTRIGTVVDLTGGDEALAKDLAMHVAASRPEALSEREMPADVVAKEKEILLAQVADSGKPAEIQEKMIQGRLSKFLKEVTLLGQPFVKDPDLSVEKLLAAKQATAHGFVRYEVGEGIDKKQDDFAAEVMAQVKGSGSDATRP